ncbi:MAG: hypothetical protein QM820_39035 [Minicystis sp.]
MAAADRSLIDAALDVILHPPEHAELTPATREDVEIELRQMIELFAAPDPEPVVEALGPWLKDRRARPILVETIGALGALEGLRWLAPLVGDASLEEDEAVRLACALGEIGGPEAESLLERMSASPQAEWPSVRREIDIALGSIRS